MFHSHNARGRAARRSRQTGTVRVIAQKCRFKVAARAAAKAAKAAQAAKAAAGDKSEDKDAASSEGHSSGAAGTTGDESRQRWLPNTIRARGGRVASGPQPFFVNCAERGGSSDFSPGHPVCSGLCRALLRHRRGILTEPRTRATQSSLRQQGEW